MDPIIQRLKERKLVQWALAYLAGAFALYQGLESFGAAWGLEASQLRLVQVLLAFGFLVTLVLAWYHGEQGRQRISGPELLILAGLLGVAAVALSMLRSEGTPVDLGETTSGAISAPSRLSVAVLPFVNMSGNPDNEYFADGIAEELLNSLAQIPALRVPGRTSSFAFKGQSLTVREIADTLDVAHVLDGSVRRDADRVVIAAQLIEAETDTNLWSDTYERVLADIFAIQRDIATAIARELQVTLGVESGGTIVAEATEMPEAHEAYLRGLFFFNQRTEESLLAAVAEFERAVGLDADYAEAWSGLADASLLIDQYSMSRRPDFADNLQRGLDAARRAIELNSQLARAHTSLAWGFMLTGRWQESERAFERAIDLNPRFAQAHQWYSFLLAIMGRADESVASAARALELDPLSLILNDDLGNALESAGRFDEAAEQYRRTLELNQSWPSGWWDLSRALLQAERYEEALDAREVAARLLRLDPEVESRAFRAIMRYRETGEPQAFSFPEGYDSHPFDEAMIYTLSGQREQALRAAEVLLEDGDLYMFAALDHDYSRDLLGDDTRYRALLERAGIYW